MERIKKIFLHHIDQESNLLFEGKSTFLINGILITLILTLSLFLGGCGESSIETPTQELLPEDTGQIMVILRDDEEDFLSYDIDVLSIDLVKVDGTQVSVAPASARVDFIQYTDLSELFSMNTLPTGSYNQITFTLDYSNANLIIQDENGDSYQATAQNTDGETMTTLALSLVLGDDEPLVISKGKISALTLDLDLAATNQIMSFTPAIVQVEPFVNVTLGIDEDREHRARGLLQSVDSDNNILTLAVKPLRKRLGEFGEITIHLDEKTLYDIDGEEVANNDALAKLASLSIDTPIVAFGSVEIIDSVRTYIATKVLAGSSVAWAGQDAFRGVVTARNDDEITISGVVLSPEDKQAVHSNNLVLSIDDSTQFIGFNQQPISAASLSVGQHIRALGEFDDVATFNSANNIVHIKLSQLTGQVVQTDPLVVDIFRFNRKPVASYNFTGTGLTTEQNADPDHYEITTNNLTIDGLADQDWLTVRGYVSDFAQAPDDFKASSLIKKELTQATANFKATWQEPTASVTVDSITYQINWDSTNAEQAMHIRGVPGNLADDNIIQAISSDDEGRYAIKERGVSIRYFAIYADFANALIAELDSGKLVQQISSKGNYDEELQGIKALAVSIILQ
ncbi:MAG: hypothetical protein QF552_11745 [Litorilituus sp.]|jgi:hypothetical protein|nr:hypothetical protein [Litorilituus sp.]